MPIMAHVHSDAEIEMIMTSLGREPGGGLVVMPDAFADIHRAVIILLAARNNVPAVYYKSTFVTEEETSAYDVSKATATVSNRGFRGGGVVEPLIPA
jgi:hypothetical protein